MCVSGRLELLRSSLVGRGRSSGCRGGCGRTRTAGGRELVLGLQEDIKDGEKVSGLDREAVDLLLVAGVYAESLADTLDYSGAGEK